MLLLTNFSSEYKCILAAIEQKRKKTSEKNLISLSSLLKTFTFQSPNCCPNKNPSNGKGLTGGSILLIVFFSVIAVYLISGMLYMKFFKQQNGLDLIPHRAFWLLIYDYIKSGFSFTKDKITGSSRTTNNYQKI